MANNLDTTGLDSSQFDALSNLAESMRMANSLSNLWQRLVDYKKAELSSFGSKLLELCMEENLPIPMIDDLFGMKMAAYVGSEIAKKQALESKEEH